jgi:putative peptidoglycan lipid II flippase
MINKIRAWESNFSLTKAAFIVGFFALVSRFVGLLRDRLLASRFGAGDTLDSYYAAFRLPDFIFNLLVLGTLSAAFIPIFTEWLHKDKKRADEIANTVLSFSFITMSAICVVLYFNAHWLTKLMVPGFHGEKLSDTISLTKIFLLSPIIFTLSNFFGSMLNAKKRFLEMHVRIKQLFALQNIKVNSKRTSPALPASVIEIACIHKARV